MSSPRPIDDGHVTALILRLDAVSELVRQARPHQPDRAPGHRMTAELVRATGMAAAALADLHAMVGRQHASTLPADAAEAWSTGVRHLRAVGQLLPRPAAALTIGPPDHGRIDPILAVDYVAPDDTDD